jgi:hypothetical protein
LCPGNTARHLQLLHPSAEELNNTRRDRVKGCPREYTHIHTGVHEDIKRKGKMRSATRLTLHSNAMGIWAAFYLNKNMKWITKKY